MFFKIGRFLIFSETIEFLPIYIACFLILKYFLQLHIFFSVFQGNRWIFGFIDRMQININSLIFFIFIAYVAAPALVMADIARVESAILQYNVVFLFHILLHFLIRLAFFKIGAMILPCKDFNAPATMNLLFLVFFCLVSFKCLV